MDLLLLGRATARFRRLSSSGVIAHCASAAAVLSLIQLSSLTPPRSLARQPSSSPASHCLSAAMGNSSYKLHEACPDLDARYKRCQSLYFENVLTPVPDQPAKEGVALPPRPIFRNGVVVTDQADVAMARDALDPASLNYACRDMWEDYKECVMVDAQRMHTQIAEWTERHRES